MAVGGKTSNPFVAHTALPLPSDDADALPSWLVPTQVGKLTVGASATDSIDFDMMALDSPTAINSLNNSDIEAPTGTGSSVSHTANEVGSSMWAAFPTIHGLTPPDRTPPGSSVDFQASGQATVTMHLTPTAAKGSLQEGALYVDTLNPFGSAGTAGLVDEVAAIPFTFTVG